MKQELLELRKKAEEKKNKVTKEMQAYWNKCKGEQTSLTSVKNRTGIRKNKQNKLEMTD